MASDGQEQADLERLGESFAWGWTLLELLEQAGWFVYVTAPFSGAIDGAAVMVVASHPDLPFPINVVGASVAACATPLLIETSKYRVGNRVMLSNPVPT